MIAECVAASPVCTAAALCMALLSVGLGLAVFRLLIGPSTPDRVVALDLAAYLAVGLISVYAVATREPSLLTGALIIGLIAFLGAVAFARYLERSR